MSDTNQLVQEQEGLINEAKQIAKEANEKIEAINKEANEQIQPKNQRITEITELCMKELRVQGGLTNE